MQSEVYEWITLPWHSPKTKTWDNDNSKYWLGILKHYFHTHHFFRVIASVHWRQLAQPSQGSWLGQITTEEILGWGGVRFPVARTKSMRFSSQCNGSRRGWRQKDPEFHTPRWVEDWDEHQTREARTGDKELKVWARVMGSSKSKGSVGEGLVWVMLPDSCLEGLFLWMVTIPRALGLGWCTEDVRKALEPFALLHSHSLSLEPKQCCFCWSRGHCAPDFCPARFKTNTHSSHCTLPFVCCFIGLFLRYRVISKYT